MTPKKKVTVEFVITLEMEYPKDWDNDMIQFKINESSWCCDNLIGVLEEYSKEHGCICEIVTGKVVSECKTLTI